MTTKTRHRTDARTDARSNGRANGRARGRIADRVDKHVLYQLSVQAPEEDSRFFARLFRRLSGRPMRSFREDFCGTAALACQVVRNHRDNRAFGVDIHGPTLEWGRRHNVAGLDEQQQQRIRLIRGDVSEVRTPKVDVIAALNFSYGVFRDRSAMLRYLRNARRSLADGGVFLLDVWGGAETQLEQEEEREVDTPNGSPFTYVWDQSEFDPVSYHTTCRIHFEFRDGSRLQNAFVYHWRIWTIPELRELMLEAGFADVEVLWEGTDPETNEGNGVFRRVRRGDADPAWIAYVVGKKTAPGSR